MKSFKARLSFLLPVFLVLFSSTLFSWQNIQDGRGNFNTDPDFHLLYGGAGTNVFGDFTATGNSILKSNNPSNADLIDDTTTYKSVDTAFNNNTYSLGDSEKMNSSSAEINLPSYVQGSDIAWAGLFWQGHVYRKTGSYSDAAIDADAANWNRVTIKDSLGTMHQIIAPIGSDDSDHKAFFHTITDTDNGYRHHYGAYRNVTDIVKNSYSYSNNTFTVGNIKTTAGQDTGGYVYISQAPSYSGDFSFGLYGGWSLIVVYNVSGSVALANSVAPKNVSIYDGFDLFLTWGSGRTPFETTIDLGGFYTPKVGAINSKLLLFGGAGDRGIEDDTLQIQDKKNTGSFNNLSNSPNQSGKQFNHTYTYLGAHMTPGDTNKQGMDLDIFDVSSSMTNEQTSTKIKFGVVKDNGHCDQIFPQVIGFSTELYEPKFCYDYAYEQNDQDFTEPNDGTKDPMLEGSGLIVGDPIKLKVFIKNMESDLIVKNVSLDIRDINNTQTTYVSNSVKVANVGEALPTSVLDASLNINTTVPSPGFTTVSDIPLNDVNPADYFYIYYDLTPQNSSIDTALDLMFNFTISPNGIDTEYHYPLGSKIPLCKNTSYAYEPANGIFNVVHNEFYNTSAGGDKYYNLPTQIVQRAGDFNVISLDYPNNPDDLISKTTIAAVDIIDNSGFHYTDASCTELESSITDRLWVIFDGASAVPFDNSVATSAFYSDAVENGAFRVSYSVDKNGSLQEISGSNNSWSFTNFPTFANTVDCVVNSGVSGSVNSNCVDTQPMTNAELKSCMECMYGLKTKLVCSKDNFSIRPEAFMIKLEDKDQNAIASDVPILNNVSGVINPDPSTDINSLAAGYQYDLNITATDHISNNPSPGYIKAFGSSSTDVIEYLWTPGATIVSDCNDSSSIQLSNKIYNGLLDINTSLPNVGIYQLHVDDTTWTTVDNDVAFMAHHTGSNFKNGLDCQANSDITVLYGDLTQNNLNGCNISSSHTNSYGGVSNLKYQNYNLEFHPYSFNMNGISIGRGLDNNTTFDTDTFIYMNDMAFNNAQDQNMSFHLNGNISAVGYDNNVTTNFVNNCFAKPVTLTLNRSARPAGVTTDLKFRYINTDKPITAPNQWHNNPANASSLMNNAVNNIALNTDDFNKTQAGVTNSILNINIDRNSSTALNPEKIRFINYQTNCTTPANCNMIAGTETTLGSNRTTTGSLDLNQTVNPNNSIDITFLYGRSHASRQRYEIPVNAVTATGTANIYYESHCFGTINGNTCKKALLPQGLNSVRTDDLRWYINENHTTNEGSAGTTTQINGGVDVTGTTVDGNITATNPNTSDQSTIQYFQNQGYPYKTTMESSASRWLIYNQNFPNATTNSFSVEFDRTGGAWSGTDEMQTNINDSNATISNRRSQW